VVGIFGALAVLATSGPCAAVLLNDWPNEAFEDAFNRCLNAWVSEGKQGVEDLTAERGRNIWARFISRGVTVQLD